MLRLLPALLAAAALAASAAKPLAAELGKPFRLKRGASARLAGTDATVRLKGFVNSPCPKGARCFWSGQAALLELTAGGTTYASALGGLPASAPYAAEVLESDYRSFARLRVTRKPATKKESR